VSLFRLFRIRFELFAFVNCVTKHNTNQMKAFILQYACTMER